MGTTIHLPMLDQIAIASPCEASWDDMVGDERKRHCGMCDLDVHNLSALTRDEAEGVLAKMAEGRVCARFYRRTDGTILTQDCPVGVARIRAAARRALVRVAALVGLVGVTGIAAASTSQTGWGDRVRLRAFKPFSVVCEWIAPAAPPASTRLLGAMGGIVRQVPMPPPPPPTPSRTGNAPGAAPGSPTEKHGE